MPFLFFPSQDVLRLALVSGAVPEDVANAPARVAWANGGVWLGLTHEQRDRFAALARLGVHFSASEPTAAWTTMPCWAFALPLRPVEPGEQETLVLFELPAEFASAFARHLHRTGPPIGLSLTQTDGRCWMTQRRTPASATQLLDERHGKVTAYVEQAPRVWVMLGHEHPTAERLIVPAGRTLLLRPPREREFVESSTPIPGLADFSLARSDVPRQQSFTAPAIPVRFRLVEGVTAPESLWVLNKSEAQEFLATADPAVHRRFEAAEIDAAGRPCFLVRRSESSRSRVAFPGSARGYSQHPRLDRLFLPFGRTLQPTLRESALARAFGCTPDRIVWLVIDRDGRLTRHSAPASGFRPLGEFVSYPSPAILPVSSRMDFAGPFDFPEFSPAETRPPVEAEIETLPPLPPIPGRVRPPAPSTSGGWFGRTIQHLVARCFGSPRRPLVEDEPPAAIAEPAQVDPKLPSPDTLLHGTDWPARRRELETRLVDDVPRSGPAERAERWAELAAAYGVVGNVPDATLCWMNAIWDSHDPPRTWLKQWVNAEARLARLPSPGDDLHGWIVESGQKPDAARVLAAATFTSAPEVSISKSTHAAILQCFDRYCDDLPVRSAWLALSRLCDGDPLALARWRDRLLSRLRDLGPGLDLDEPSFMRFHGTASSERFQLAREWLSRARDPVRTWFRKVRGGRLREVGLEPETTCTAAYMDLLLAWGLGCVGERTKSQSLAEHSRAVLQRASESSPNGKVHGLLLRMLSQRIREAQDGRTAKLAWPAGIAGDFDSLPDIGRYAVDRLRAASRILEPTDRVHPYRGRNLKHILGADLLSDRLQLLLERTDPAILAEEARELLEACEFEPTTTNVPRVVLTLLELAPRLEPAIVAGALSLAVPALDWMETWLQSQSREEQHSAVLARLMELSLLAAAAADLPDVGRSIADLLVSRVAVADRNFSSVFSECTGSILRSLNKLGLTRQIESVLTVPDVWRARQGETAVGWFDLGRDDIGTRVLDECRDRLFLSHGDQGAEDFLVSFDGRRERTRLAIAYADALGAAPPRLALGRLEELFQRLGPIDLAGTTNVCFTLQPLRLIDTVVRAVVGEQFNLGPRVQSWLEDDEFLIRQRIQRDMSQVLRQHGFG